MQLFLTTSGFQFHFSLLEAVYISRKQTDLLKPKQFVFTFQPQILHLVDLKQTRGEKEKRIEKKICSCCEGFLRSRVFDWFDWTYSQREWAVKKKRQNCRYPVH